MKISVLSSQCIIQVFRLINMLLSCIYTFVYCGSIAFLRDVINGQHGKKGIAILCLFRQGWQVALTLPPASLCYCLVITGLLIFRGRAGNGQGKRTHWTNRPFGLWAQWPCQQDPRRYKNPGGRSCLEAPSSLNLDLSTKPSHLPSSTNGLEFTLKSNPTSLHCSQCNS